MVAPLEDAEQVSAIAFGYMASKALFVALHLDVFTRLAEAPYSAGALAQAAAIPEHRMTTLLTALTAVGLLSFDGERFANSPAAGRFLAHGATHDFGDYLRFQIDRQMFPFMQQLEGVVKGELPPDAVDSYAAWMSDPEEARIYCEAQHAGSLGPGKSLARLIDLGGVAHLLDIAGGTGGFAIRLCQANPELRVTILDFPNVVALGAPKIAAAGLSDRITFIGGNALDARWPQAVDAVLMSYLFSGVTGSLIPELVARAHAVLCPGGRYMVHDFMVENDRSGPPLAALWQLQHMAFTPDARSVTAGWLAGVMVDAGFTGIEVADLVPGMTKVVWGRRAG